jgi:hypothetical protein
MKRTRKTRPLPMPEQMGPSPQYLRAIREQMEMLDDCPEFVARAVHEFGLARGLTVRSEAELNRLLLEGKRPILPGCLW